MQTEQTEKVVPVVAENVVENLVEEEIVKQHTFVERPKLPKFPSQILHQFEVVFFLLSEKLFF